MPREREENELSAKVAGQGEAKGKETRSCKRQDDKSSFRSHFVTSYGPMWAEELTRCHTVSVLKDFARPYAGCDFNIGHRCRLGRPSEAVGFLLQSVRRLASSSWRAPRKLS